MQQKTYRNKGGTPETCRVWAKKNGFNMRPTISRQRDSKWQEAGDFSVSIFFSPALSEAFYLSLVCLVKSDQDP
jgi:hypothetical protein